MSEELWGAAPITESELVAWMAGASERVLRLPSEDRARELAVSVAARLGYEFASEKPDETGSLYASSGRLDDWIIYYPDDRWPALTPARVVPAGPVELEVSRGEVERAVAAQSLTNGWTITGITDAIMELLEASK